MTESYEEISVPWPGYRRGLYAITPSIGADGEQWLRKIDQALDGGIVMLQIRDKTAEPDFLEHYAGRAVELCAAAGVPERRFILEHSGAAITLSSGASDIPVGAAVSLFPGCDHSAATCAAKFSNAANYGGFPYMPTKNPFGGDPIY
jgi:hypothetical protein